MNDNPTYIDRIYQISENEKISISYIEKKIGASKGVLSRAISHKTDIQAKWLIKIVENFPDINPEWLLTGRGPMLRTAPPANPQPPPHTPEADPRPAPPSSQPAIPLLAAHQLPALSPSGQQPAPPPGAPLYLIPEFAQAAALFRLSGDAMAPTLLPGDLLALRPVSPQPLLQWHRPHLALTDQGPLVRRILPPQAATPAQPSQPEHLLLRADNPAYPDVTLPLPHLRALFLIIGFLRIE